MKANGDALSVLADPTRRAIVDRLRSGPQCVGDLCAHLPVSQPAVSQHLRVLREAGLVDLEKEGTRHIYRLCSDGIDDLRAYVESLWDGVLDAFARSEDVSKGDRSV